MKTILTIFLVIGICTTLLAVIAIFWNKFKTHNGSRLDEIMHRHNENVLNEKLDDLKKWRIRQEARKLELVEILDAHIEHRHKGGHKGESCSK